MRSRSARVGVLLQVLDDVELDAPLAEDLDRTPRLAATRVEVHLHGFHDAQAIADAHAAERRRRRAGRPRSASRSRYSARGTSTAPSDSRCGVVHCTSSNDAPPAAAWSTERHQRDLRRIACPVELRLGREQAADRHAVQPADERARTRRRIDRPRLDAVGPAQPVQLGVRADELPVDPAVGTTRVGAPPHDLLERGVDAHVEPPARPPQRPAHHAARRAG